MMNVYHFKKPTGDIVEVKAENVKKAEKKLGLYDLDLISCEKIKEIIPISQPELF